MTSNRKEPTFSNSGASDVSQARDSGATASAASPRPQRSAPPPRQAPPAKGSSGLVIFTLLIALGGLGLAGYGFYQSWQSQQLLTSAEGRIAQLEDKLRLTDDESSQSLSVLQANLKEANKSLELAHSEIRKLWDTRNVNKKAITENGEKLAAVTKTVNTASTKASSAETLAKSQEANWKALSDDLTRQAEQYTVVSGMADSQQKQIRELVDSARQVESQVAELKKDLSGRVASNEEAIKAIDAYRRSINSDLLELKNRISSGQ